MKKEEKEQRKIGEREGREYTQRKKKEKSSPLLLPCSISIGMSSEELYCRPTYVSDLMFHHFRFTTIPVLSTKAHWYMSEADDHFDEHIA